MDLSNLMDAVAIMFSFKIIFIIIIGVGAGIVVGVLPGLSATMAVALLTSLTFGWSIYPAIILMISTWVGACYGGSKSSVLINIPGTGAAFATTFDGFPMAQNGQSAYAMGVATVASTVGGLFGAILLAGGAPMVAKIGLQFGPPEYLLLVIWGLTAIGSVSGKSFGKGVLTACLGLAVSMVGLDTIYGIGRFTFNNIQLQGGINFIPALIGAFGLAEVLIQLEKQSAKSVAGEIGADSLRNYFMDFFRQIPLTLRCSVIGAIIGAIPGIGGEVASVVAYDHAKRTIKKPSKPFGEGAYEGVLAPETANNAAIGGSLIPLLTLGIPGDAVTAILLGALIIHGIRPGPLVFNQGGCFFGVIVLTVILAHFAMLWLGLSMNKLLAMVVRIPTSVLMPIVITLSVVGSFAVENRIFDVYLMLIFGIIGYFLRKGDYPIGPFVLGTILGNMADGELRRTFALYGGELHRAFLMRPIALTLIFLIVMTIFSQSKMIKTLLSRFFLKFKKEVT
jgi:putative tricarboxylic transport membrane protein